MKNRNRILDIMRAIAIISVVFGHTMVDNFFLRKFIYLFHLPLFFFISGFLYKEKDSSDPWSYIGKKLKRFLPLYCTYVIFYVLFHNVFFHLGILDSSNSYYYIGDIVRNILSSFFFLEPIMANVPFSGPLWFVPILFVGLVVYNFIVYFANKVNIKHKELLKIVIILCLTIVGLYVYRKNYNIAVHYQTVLVILPFIYLGNIVNKYKEKIKPNIILSICLTVLTFFLLKYTFGYIELSENVIWNPILFYIYSVIMIYNVYVFSYFVDKYLNKISKCLEYVGRHTFEIMALHVMFFKLYDFYLIKFFTKNYSILGKYPFSYEYIRITYTIVGVVCSLLFVELIRLIKKKILNTKFIQEKRKMLNI